MGSELQGSKDRQETVPREVGVERWVMQSWGRSRSVRLGKEARLGCSQLGEGDEGVQLPLLAQVAGVLGMTPAQPRWGLGSQGFLQNMPGHSGLRYSSVPAAPPQPFGSLPSTGRGASSSALQAPSPREVQACAKACRHGTHAARVAVKAVHLLQLGMVMHSLKGGQRVGVGGTPLLQKSML